MRPAWPGYFSIEQLFESLEPHLAAAFDVRIVRVPAQGAGLAAIARNLIFTARLRADVIHVTGLDDLVHADTMLFILGPRINSLRVMPKRLVEGSDDPERGFWNRWARTVTRS